jgi:hypothetical protein
LVAPQDEKSNGFEYMKAVSLGAAVKLLKIITFEPTAGMATGFVKPPVCAVNAPVTEVIPLICLQPGAGNIELSNPSTCNTCAVEAKGIKAANANTSVSSVFLTREELFW